MNLIEPLNLCPDATIADAFGLLRGNYGMVVTVTDSSGSLLGIVSDGDLRTVLLQGLSIEEKLISVMNKNPVTIEEDSLQDVVDIGSLTSALEKNGIPLETVLRSRIAIPVVDSQNRVVGLTNLDMLRYSEGMSQNNSGRVPHVLVVGGAGYIGSMLTEVLLERGWRVRVLDKFIYGSSSLSRFQKHEMFSCITGDVCDLNSQLVAISDVDCVVFLAEIVGDPSCEYLPKAALRTNYLAVSSMATLCAHMHIHRFVYTSSCSVYGESVNPNEMLSETSTLNPVTHYARMKVATEEALFNQLNPLFSPTVLRLATIFGYSYRPRFDLVVNTFAKNAYFDKIIRVFGGGQWRPNIHVKDVGEVIARVLEAPIDKVSRKVINVGKNSENYKITDLAAIANDVNPDCLVEMEKEIKDDRNYRVDFSRLRELLDYEPRRSVKDGFRELKAIFESGLITDPTKKHYSNLQSLMEFEVE